MNTEEMDTTRYTRRTLLAGFGAATLSWMTFQQSMLKPQPARPAARGTGGIPNPTVYTHEGRAVRFYDDLIRDKVVAINMMYAQCAGICPLATSNLLQVQDMLGERAGRDVFMYSITLQPEQDIPRGLRLYAERHGVKPGWLFLTGAPADIRLLRYRLGFYDRDTKIDEVNETHTSMVRIGNAACSRWTMAPALAEPEQILATINHVDPAVVHTGTI